MEQPNGPGGRWRTLLELLVLVALLGGLGVRQVPAHWTSIWQDREFTGYVVPIANRLAVGGRLYEDGLRSPMPPMPYVFLAVLTRGNGRWIDESGWCFAFQSATILLLFAASSVCWPRPLPLFASLGTVPLFLALPKVILYDAMAQFLIAACGGSMLAALHRTGRWRNIGLAVAGGLAALTLLTKQSGAAGLLLGCGVALLAFGREPGRPFVRINALATFSLAFVVALLLGLAALSPWASPTGFVHDVLITGSEPKGGLGRIVVTMISYGAQLLIFTLTLATLAVGGRGLFGPRGERSVDAPRVSATLPILAGGFIGLIAFSLLPMTGLTQMGGWQSTFQPISYHTMVVILNGVLILGLWGGAQENRGDVRWYRRAVTVFFPAAVGFSLSTAELRWTYDNNPLLFVVWLAGGAMLRKGLRGLSLPAARWMLAAPLVLAWWGYSSQLLAIHECTESWPEVRHLAGARLRPASAGMRELVAVVRTSSRRPGDAVLLLPNDPNVESWFERPRPPLTAAVCFVDQYWDRYVEEDLARLHAHPPRVIVIGPRPYWRWFGRGWQPDRGTERLIDRIAAELLPQRYDLHRTVSVSHQRSEAYLDVFVRRDD